jgi:trimeric autotransporter adhesin
MHNRALLFLILFFCLVAACWSQPYMISTVAGTDRLLNGHSADTVPLRGPLAVAVDSAGNLYIADAADNRIRKVDTSGVIGTYAGTGVASYNGDRIKATEAQLNFPTALAFDASGNLLIVDQGNSRVRVISSDGIINTVAGNGSPGILGDNGPALEAQVNPLAIAVDKQGNLFISTLDFHIRKVDTNGTITTIAGTGNPAYAGDNGPAKSAAIGQSPALICDAKGDLYIADPQKMDTFE